jgi:hypothetical protein
MSIEPNCDESSTRWVDIVPTRDQVTETLCNVLQLAHWHEAKLSKLNSRSSLPNITNRKLTLRRNKDDLRVVVHRQGKKWKSGQWRKWHVRKIWAFGRSLEKEIQCIFPTSTLLTLSNLTTVFAIATRRKGWVYIHVLNLRGVHLHLRGMMQTSSMEIYEAWRIPEIGDTRNYDSTSLIDHISAIERKLNALRACIRVQYGLESCIHLVDLHVRESKSSQMTASMTPRADCDVC